MSQDVGIVLNGPTKPLSSVHFLFNPNFRQTEIAMKRFGIGLLMLLMMGCVEDSRKKVVVYSPHGKDLLKAYEVAFEAQNPHVDVVWLDMGAQAVYERIRTEAANPQADLWWGAPNILFQQAADEGLLMPYRPSWASQVEETHRDTKDRWYGNFLTPVGIAFNAETVKDPPKTWDELLDPKWKGRILVRYPLESGTMVALFGALILRQPTEQEGMRWLAKLDQQTKTYTADPTQLYIKLARQEGDLTLWNLPDILLQQKKRESIWHSISYRRNTRIDRCDCIGKRRTKPKRSDTVLRVHHFARVHARPSRRNVSDSSTERHSGRSSAGLDARIPHFRNGHKLAIVG